MSYSVYILQLRDGQLYVGSTDNLERRIQEHREGRGSRTTRLAKMSDLLYSEDYPGRSSAEKRERQLKGWSRAKKHALIRGDLSHVHCLAKRRN